MTYRVAVRALVAVAVVLVVAAIAAAAHGASPTTANLRLDGMPLRPELALTPAQQQRGLMFRKKAPADGMLFVFSRASSGGFWMKNTLVPLKISFFDSAGKSVKTFRMTPCRKDPCAIYDPGREYRFALELPVTDVRPAQRLGPPAKLQALIARAEG